MLISLIKVSNIVRSFAFVPKSLSFEVPSLTCGRRKGGTKLSAKEDTSPSFSEESLTTRISPTTRFGPFGSGGTVVGFSKYPGVRRAFEENFAQRLELGSQLVVYMEGEKVVDLYGFAPETIVDGRTKNYDGDTLQVVASSGKNMEAIAVAMLVDRGLVRYEDPVQKHWPEFGANGKGQITIADVMRHAGGVPFVLESSSQTTTIPITTQDIFEVIPMEKKICNAPKHPPTMGSSVCYHAFTRGFLVNGILRRVDPSGRSLGRFLKEEVTDPLSKQTNEPVKFFCGIPTEDQADHTFAPLTIGSKLYTLVVQVLPALLGFNPQLAAYLRWLFLRKDGFRGVARAVVFPYPTPTLLDYASTPEGRSIEFSSAGMHANARSMAQINALAMAGDGSLGGVNLLGAKSVEASMGGVQTANDSATGLTLGFTRGGYCRFSESFRSEHVRDNALFHPDDETAYGNFVGWGGAGGSLSLVDRRRNISFAYCPNGSGLDALWGIRTRRILLELQRALAE